MARPQQGTVTAIIESLADAVKTTLSVADSAARRRRRLEDEQRIPVHDCIPSSDSEDDATPATPSPSRAPAASPEVVVIPPLPLPLLNVEENGEAGAFRGKHLEMVQRQVSQEAVEERDVVAAAVSTEEAEPLLPRRPSPAGAWYHMFHRRRRRSRRQASSGVPYWVAPLVGFCIVVGVLLVWFVVYVTRIKQPRTV